ncbi:MAG TPA: hypothetical protein VET23_08690 [Chitinophagaceae bacterium]|nr:hypothetical protein [Chitinophagaceae bacterium]
MISSELKIRQFRHESNTWKRTLEFIMQENTHLKNRLCEVLKTVLVDEDLVNAAEQYQNHFVREDEAIHLLRGDIANHDKLLVREVYEDGNLIRDVVRRQKKLATEVKNATLEFHKLKFDFNNYLGEAL